MNKPEKQDSTSTPTNGAPVQGVAVETPKPDSTALVIGNFPRIQDTVERVPVKYGDSILTLPIGSDKTVTIDAFFFQSPTNFRLKKIGTALKGLETAKVTLPDGKPVDSAWFNTNVRDPFHKVLKYAAKQSLEHGVPVSLAFTRRTMKNGSQIVTAKHAFEHATKAPEVAQIEASAAKAAEKANKQSAKRAKRQKSKRISPMPNPVIPPTATIETPATENVAA